MPTECSLDLFGFAPVEGREVVAAFDAGSITSDAGALLLGATDRAIKMMDRFASCFHDVRRQELIEHEVVTLIRQRVFGIALGYEDLNDHDELRHDPLMAVLAGKLEARRDDCHQHGGCEAHKDNERSAPRHTPSWFAHPRIVGRPVLDETRAKYEYASPVASSTTGTPLVSAASRRMAGPSLGWSRSR